MTNIRSERGNITTNLTEIENVIREFYEQLHAKKLGNLGKKCYLFLETHNPPRLNQEDVENLNRPNNE